MDLLDRVRFPAKALWVYQLNKNGQFNPTQNGAPHFSVSYMNMSIDPRADFAEYVSGKWKQAHPLPANKSRFDTFDELWDWNLEQLRAIAEECKFDDISTYRKQVGRFYASAMDIERINARRFAPISNLMKKINAVHSIGDAVDLIPELHLAGVPVFFNAFSDGDKKNSSIYSLYLYQGGLSLPDKDYYLGDSTAFAEIRPKFIKHMEKMMSLFGLSDRASDDASKAVFETELEIAKASRAAADLRDPERNYNRMTIKDLNDRYGPLKINDYMKRIGVPAIDYAVVGQPEFFEAVNSLIVHAGIEKIRSYLIWHLISNYAPFLHKEIDDEHFNFFRRTLIGQKEQEERWKRAVKTINACIGEALGRIYIEKHFGNDAKTKMNEMVSDIIEVFRGRLKNMDWMANDTRSKALAKLDKINPKIGCPDKFRDYSSVSISDDYAGNVIASAAFELHRQASRVGKPVDKSEWGMTPPTVNAYYSETENQIVFPAGILQPPFFDSRMDPAVNYGGIGSVICHEITHGFDDQGRRFDADGNLKNWWNDADNSSFSKKADLVEHAYSSMEAMHGRFINGKLTLGENIADLGGVSIAFDALNRKLKRDGGTDPMTDGFSQEQRFFIAWGQIWKYVISDAEMIRLLTIDPHSPNKYRASIPAMSHAAFDTAFPGKETETVKKVRGIGIW